MYTMNVELQAWPCVWNNPPPPPATHMRKRNFGTHVHPVCLGQGDALVLENGPTEWEALSHVRAFKSLPSITVL